MKEWYLINPQPTLNSGYEKDEFADYAQDGFDELLTETQLGKDIVFCKGQFDGEKFEVEVAGQGIVQSETPDAYTQGYKRQLLTRIGEIADYKYIRYDNAIWIIMTEPADNCIYDKCVLHLCNYVLKWQLNDNSVVYYPANIENSSQYNNGEDGNKTLTLGFNQFIGYVSLDDVSVLIERDKRLFIDYNKEHPLPYKITRPDTVSFSYGKGRVLTMIFTEDQYNPTTDLIEEWLCDYKPQVQNTVTITYKGSPVLRIGGRKTLTAETTGTVSSWSVDNPNVTITPNGNSAIISCDNNEDYIGQSFKVTAVLATGEMGECGFTIVGGV